MSDFDANIKTYCSFLSALILFARGTSKVFYLDGQKAGKFSYKYVAEAQKIEEIS